MFDVLLARLRVAENQIAMLEKRVKKLEDTVDIMHECTGTYGSRLEDLEKWQEKVDDKLDQEL
jgi:hypothetical protein